MTTEPKAGIHYLTVQDILWINHEVTREVLPYKYAQLEEATFGQYAYGGSRDVIDQAANFLSSFTRLKPFERGNRGTAFIAVMAFLALNGHTVVLEPSKASDWYLRASGRTVDARIAILNAIAEGDPQPLDLRPAVRTIVRDLLKAFGGELANIENA